MIFKLGRERPAYSLHENHLYYVERRVLRRLDVTTNKDFGLLQLRGNNDRSPVHSISYNPFVNSVLIVTRAENVEHSIYDLYKLSTETTSLQKHVDIKRSFGAAALWIAMNRLAVLEKHSVVLI